MQTTKDRFAGRLTDSASAKNAAMQVILEIVDDTLEITLNNDEQWAWEMAEVSVSRVAIDRFRLQLAEENLFFLPVDPILFSKRVVEQYSETPVEPFRGYLRRRIEAAQAEGGPVFLALATA